MNNTLLTDDVIVVNKLVYGPKVPGSLFEISWVNLLFNYRSDYKKELANHKQFYTRAKGISAIERGDVLVYQASDTYTMVKRCVAVAGDVLTIFNGDVYTNHKKYVPALNTKNIYRLIIKNKSTYFKILDSFNYDNKISSTDYFHRSFIGTFTYQEIENIQQNAQIIIGKITDSNWFHGPDTIFAHPLEKHWTLDNIGPFTVPKKGMKIILDSENYSIYGKTIRNYEGVKIAVKRNKYYVNSQLATSYTFAKDYYFMMGDNREEAIDSRYSGPIPEDIIIGKSPYILFSNNDDKFRWNRFLKKIL
jgi:signal peptidase I